MEILRLQKPKTRIPISIRLNLATFGTMIHHQVQSVVLRSVISNSGARIPIYGRLSVVETFLQYFCAHFNTPD